jgi:hypothetical protein
MPDVVDVVGFPPAPVLMSVVFEPPVPAVPVGVPAVVVGEPVVYEGGAVEASEQAPIARMPARATKQEICVRIFNSSSDTGWRQTDHAGSTIKRDHTVHQVGPDSS